MSAIRHANYLLLFCRINDGFVPKAAVSLGILNVAIGKADLQISPLKGGNVPEADIGAAAPEV